MEEKTKTGRSLSRRRLLTLVSSSVLLPYLSFGKELPVSKDDSKVDDEEYDTFLKADGTVVRVKRKSSRRARILRKRVSNKSLLSWLNKK